MSHSEQADILGVTRLGEGREGGETERAKIYSAVEINWGALQ